MRVTIASGIGSLPSLIASHDRRCTTLRADAPRHLSTRMKPGVRTDSGEDPYFGSRGWPYRPVFRLAGRVRAVGPAGTPDRLGRVEARVSSGGLSGRPTPHQATGAPLMSEARELDRRWALVTGGPKGIRRTVNWRGRGRLSSCLVRCGSRVTKRSPQDVIHGPHRGSQRRNVSRATPRFFPHGITAQHGTASFPSWTSVRVRAARAPPLPARRGRACAARDRRWART
jgi:hypothetical protein